MSATKRTARKPKDTYAEALKATNAALRAWLNVQERQDPIPRAMAQILVALHAAAKARDLDDLNTKTGPRRWALAYARKEETRRAKEPVDPRLAHLLASKNVLLWDKPNPLFMNEPQTAREFVNVLDFWRGNMSWGAYQDETEARRIGEAADGWLRFVGVMTGMVPQKALTESHERALIAAVVKAAGRDRCDSKAVAVALLKAWGLTADQARNAMKHKDL